MLRRLECLRQQFPPNSPMLLPVISDTLKFLERAGMVVQGETLARELLSGLQNLGGGHDAIARPRIVSVGSGTICASVTSYTRPMP